MSSYTHSNRATAAVMAIIVIAAVWAGAEPVDTPSAPLIGSPPFALIRLPYPNEALEPYISTKTISFHYSKHHQAYVDNLNKLILGTEWAKLSLEDIIKKTVDTTGNEAIFINAAQAWNHNLFWQGMKNGGGGKPAGKLMDMIVESFVSFDAFKEAFTTAAVTQFGSGWVWLVQDGQQLKIVTTSNADTPLARGQIPLLTCDLWEHAYYLDYQNRRKEFVQAFLEHLVYWDVVATRLKVVLQVVQ